MTTVSSLVSRLGGNMVRLFRRSEVKEYSKLFDVTLVYEVDVEVWLSKRLLQALILLFMIQKSVADEEVCFTSDCSGWQRRLFQPGLTRTQQWTSNKVRVDRRFIKSRLIL